MTTKSNSIRRIITKVRIFCPRLDVMRVQSSSAFPASLASPIVSAQYGGSKRFIFPVLEICLSRCSASAFPIWMSWTNQVNIARRDASGPLTAKPNRSAMLWRKRSTCLCQSDISYGLTSRTRRHHLALPACLTCLFGNLSSYFWAFCHIVAQITIGHFARIAAKEVPSLNNCIPALDARLDRFHQ